jgi:hypothetical protein
MVGVVVDKNCFMRRIRNFLLSSLGVLSSEGDWCGGRMLYDVVAYQQLQLVPLTSKVSAGREKLGCGLKV